MTLTNTTKDAKTCLTCRHKGVVQADREGGEPLAEPCFTCYRKMDEGVYFSQWAERSER